MNLCGSEYHFLHALVDLERGGQHWWLKLNSAQQNRNLTRNLDLRLYPLVGRPAGGGGAGAAEFLVRLASSCKKPTHP